MSVCRKSQPPKSWLSWIFDDWLTTVSVNPRLSQLANVFVFRRGPTTTTATSLLSTTEAYLLPFFYLDCLFIFVFLSVRPWLAFGNYVALFDGPNTSPFFFSFASKDSLATDDDRRRPRRLLSHRIRPNSLQTDRNIHYSGCCCGFHGCYYPPVIIRH